MTGKLITFEGPEGCGKTTLIKGIKPKIATLSKKAMWLREPGGTDIGEEIRKILLDKENEEIYAETELLLMEASRAQLVRQKIIPYLKQDYIILCDRFMDSSTAYQGFGRRLGADTVMDYNNYATRGVVPDLTILALLPYDVGMQRIKHRGKMDRLDAESREFHERVLEGYVVLAKAYPDRIKVIDATKSPEEMQEMAWEEIKKII